MFGLKKILKRLLMKLLPELIDIVAEALSNDEDPQEAVKRAIDNKQLKL
jgi:hypothetical protein